MSRLMSWPEFLDALGVGNTGALFRPSPTHKADPRWWARVSVVTNRDEPPREMARALAAAGRVRLEETSDVTYVGIDGAIVGVGEAGCELEVVCRHDPDLPILDQVRAKLAIEGLTFASSDPKDLAPDFAPGVTAEAVRQVLSDVATTSVERRGWACRVTIHTDGDGVDDAQILYDDGEFDDDHEEDPESLVRDEFLFVLVEAWAKPRGSILVGKGGNPRNRSEDYLRVGRRFEVEFDTQGSALLRVAAEKAARRRLRSWLRGLGAPESLAEGAPPALRPDPGGEP